MLKHFFTINNNWSDILNILGPYMSLGSFFDGNFFAVTISDKGMALLGAGMATTGCLGAGIGQGFSAGKACESIGRNPDAINKVRTIMIIGAAIAESGAIYSLLIALILIFVRG